MKVDNCWANIDKKEGGLNSKVNIYFDENDTGANRSVKIRVSSRDGSVSEECTLVHKKREQVVYRNKRQSALFTKEGCNSETEKGEELEYVVEAGKYTSIISQSDADDKAMKDIEQNGQNWVNEHGRCITILWYNVKKSKSFRKNDCDPDTEEGSLVTMTIEAGQFSSTISQEDADRKAEAELNAKGQDYANSHGTCNTIKWYNDRKSKMFQKTDCEVTEVGSMVEYVVEAGRFSSSVSKEDANQKALDALEAEGPGYANEHGTCETNLWYNVEKSKVFYKNDCEDGFIGAPYTYTVEAGKYTSDVSQEDADKKALDEIEKNGHDQANLNGECVTDPNYFVGKASARVQKNDCDAESQTGSFVDLTEKDLAGYPDAFVSRESQEAANALAEAAMEEQKQDLANKKGTCIDKNQFVGVYSKVFTKDNCEGEGVGSQVTVDQDDVTGGPFTSYESQEAANALAQAAVEQQGQAIANRDGHCTWTGKYSEEFTKNDCDEGQVGSKITVTEQDVVGAPFTSTVSQDDANNKAQAAVKEQGQAIANNKGNCEDMTVYTGHYSKRFVPECEACHKGVEMEVTAEMVNGSPVTSTESQEAADAEARRIVEEGGQAYANKNGNCTPLSTDPVWEDVEPEELRCNEGKSQKKQRDTNECSETHNQERWVDGGNKVCSWTGHYTETFQKNDCEIPDSGTEVEVSEADVEGNPFTSFVSQEDADNKAKEAVKAQGQNIANQKGKCRFVGVYSKEFTKDNCGSCQHGVPMSVTQDMVGGPFYSKESQEDAYQMACQSMVLLKNEDRTLPLSDSKRIALVGPFANTRYHLLGSWNMKGDSKEVITVEEGFKALRTDIPIDVRACDFSGITPAYLSDVCALAQKNEIIIACLGEPSTLSGEAVSTAKIELPDQQMRLLKALKTTGKKIIVVLFNGRPLVLDEVLKNCDALLEAWYPGTMGGKAVAALLTGIENPSGKLSQTFPRHAGQIPIVYNARRTFYTVHHADIPQGALFPFGFGLSYTQYKYSSPVTDKTEYRRGDSVTVRIKIKNTGSVAGREIVQLYIRDEVATVIPREKELKRFASIHLQPGEEKEIRFTIPSADFSIYNNKMEKVLEP